MPTWCFKTAARATRASTVHHWYWQIDTQHTLIAITSTKLFTTIEDCIANARENGFRGEVEVPEGLSPPATITCEEGDYVHAIVERSVTARANRSAA
jgi:hypothetical protein